MPWGNGDSSRAGAAAESVRPFRAPVVPRVCATPGGAALPLHERIQKLLGAGARGPVNVYGPSGSGKSVALSHLAATLSPDAPVTLRDDGNYEWAREAGRDRLAVFASRQRQVLATDSAFEMTLWEEDDCIEYLLAAHRDRCASIVPRLKACADRTALAGLPELWRVVLDAMAEDPDLPDVAAALRHHLASQLDDPNARDAAMRFSVLSLRWEADPDPTALPRIPQDMLWSNRDQRPGAPVPPAGIFGPVYRLIRHRPVRVVLAAQWLLWELRRGAGRDLLNRRLPADLVREAGRLIAMAHPGGPDVGQMAQRQQHQPPSPLQRLEAIVEESDERHHPLAVSLLHAAGVGWRPRGQKLPLLAGADFRGAPWEGVDLGRAVLIDSDLSGADLCHAILDGAMAERAAFCRANLAQASLLKLCVRGADLSFANLTRADARDAEFARANLIGASLDEANLDDARFEGADLTGASLRRAWMRQATLSHAKIAGADFSGSDLTGATFEAVPLREARLDRACLRRAVLLSCDLEGVELPDAEFSGAALQGSYLTGSRLRGASFRRADLRDTGLADVDWEGADLRNADLRGASFHLGSTRSGLVGSSIPCEGSRTGFYTDDYFDQDFKPPEEIRKANLRSADLRGAKIKGVDFYLVDLRGARYTPKQEKHLRRCGAILGEG